MILTRYSKLYLFWKIGKNVYENELLYDNVFQKFSDYYSYYYGNSKLYTRENIHLMKRFYLNFPIFTFNLNSITWEQYQVLLLIPNKKERLFYFSLSLFFHSDLHHTKELISNHYYYRI